MGEGVRSDRQTVEGVICARARGVAYERVSIMLFGLLTFTYITVLCWTLIERRELGHVKTWHLREVAEMGVIEIWSCRIWVELGDIGLHVYFVLVLMRLSSLTTSVYFRVLHESVRRNCETLIITQLSALL